MMTSVLPYNEACHRDALLSKPAAASQLQHNTSTRIRREMIVVPAVAAAVGVLAAFCARNMAETLRISRTDTFQLTILPSKTAEEAVSRIQSMKRKEILELFMACKVPSDVSLIKGEWNGCLLKNNWILTSTTRFLTDGLFGRGRPWNGKEFRQGGVGNNRFDSKGGGTECHHEFDYAIEASRLSSDPSVVLRYSKHQFPLSLWYTMMDEVRVVTVKNGQVMIGMGCMAWSGGMLNASPFLLWRE